MASEQHFGQTIKNAEHLTWSDHLRAGFQGAGNQGDYLQQMANQRKAEYDLQQAKQRAAGQGQPAQTSDSN